MMASLAVLMICLLPPLAASQFVPPDAVLQAGYRAGFRAFIPDFPGCELFSFHGKINSPFIGEEGGTFSQDILHPEGGFWTFLDKNVILTPGDIIHYWTMVVKDKVGYPKRNQTWKVPDPDESVDLLSPITLKPPRATPEKMRDTEPTTPIEGTTTPTTETAPTTSPSEKSTSNEPATTTMKTTPSTISTTKATEATTKQSTTTQKPTTTTPKTSSPAKPLIEEVEELPTPALPFDKPSEFPEEPPSLFPFPSLFPRPFKPMTPPSGSGFEICSNPWNFEEQIGESRTQRLERQVAKLQCELALFKRGNTQLGNTVERELTDMKKLIYNMVGRMARLESVIRNAAFG